MPPRSSDREDREPYSPPSIFAIRRARSATTAATVSATERGEGRGRKERGAENGFSPLEEEEDPAEAEEVVQAVLAGEIGVQRRVQNLH